MTVCSFNVLLVKYVFMKSNKKLVERIMKGYTNIPIEVLSSAHHKLVTIKKIKFTPQTGNNTNFKKFPEMMRTVKMYKIVVYSIICGIWCHGIKSSIFLPSLPKTPGFTIICLSLFEYGSHATFFSQKGDGAFLKLSFGLRGNIRGHGCSTSTFFMWQLQIHIFTADKDNTFYCTNK